MWLKYFVKMSDFRFWDFIIYKAFSNYRFFIFFYNYTFKKNKQKNNDKQIINN